jgi:hypothetical protein
MLIILTGFNNWGGAQVSLPTFGTAYFQDFNTLATSGTSSTLPTGWALFESLANADNTYAADAGTNNAGNTYSYGVGTTTERAFGELQSGTLLPTIGCSFINNTGGAIGYLMISYKGEQWRVGTVDHVDQLDFQYSTTATALNTGTYTDFNALDFVSPVTTPVGALNGNNAPNFTVKSSTITGLSIANGGTFWIRWNDFNASGADDGEAVDSFTLIPCPAVTCPANISVCANAAPINLTGGTPAGGTYSGNGVSMNVFTPSTAGVGVHTITYTYTTGLCTGSCTFTITVNALPNPSTGSYPAACTNDPNINLVGTPAGGIWSGTGVVNGNQFDPNAGTQTVHYTVTDNNGCSNSASTVIMVNECLMAPEMRWVLLQNGAVNNACVSTSSCPSSICFGLQYTPSITGTMTSYTTVFFIPCYTGNTNPVLSDGSCVLSTGGLDGGINDCSSSGNWFWRFLGASSPSYFVTAGVPVIVHQACFAIPSSPVNIIKYPNLPWSVSITPPGGGGATDAPTYTTFTLDGSLYCTLLPVKYLQFDADKFGDLTTRLDWVTAEEINNAYFEVQRSNDVTEEFETIGRVEAVENPRSVNPYQFYDHAAKPGVNYYRLKQFDNDGQFTYSPIRAVSFHTTTFDVKAWPNPVDNLLNVFISHADQSGRMELVDLAGRHILYHDFDEGDSNNELDVNDLTPGVYTLVVTTGVERYVEKIVVME